MELKDFVKTTLVELSDAIHEAGKELGTKITLTSSTLRVGGVGNDGLIDFDLAVDARESAKVSGGAGIRIAVLKAELDGDKEVAAGTTSHIKFTVQANFDSSRLSVRELVAKQERTEK